VPETPPPFDRWRPHPWHGLTAGRDVPRCVLAFVEITPFDTVKYEIDKPSGYLRVDRPQRTSSLPPTLYGFIPRTYCGARVARTAPGGAGAAEQGDGDPLDVCVLSERPVSRAETIMDAVVVGGIRTLDRGVADDKIIAVLEGDVVWGGAKDVRDVPEGLVERLRHYFGSYKAVVGGENPITVAQTYGAEHARKVVQAALEDYAERFGRAADAP
jgi:inorganic pyrophosphatase